MNFGRLLFCLVAVSLFVTAATVEQNPKGITVPAGQTLELVNRTIQTPSVLVEDGGTLVLSGTTLLMSGATDGAANIWVKKGGSMQILVGSNITSANDKNYAFWVDAGSAFEMRDSLISRCGMEGLPEKNRGPYVQANNAIVENNVFGDNYYCLYLNGTQSAKVIGNNFTVCSWQALVVQYSVSTEVSSNDFGENNPDQYSLAFTSSLNSVISDNVFQRIYGLDIGYGVNSTSVRNNSFEYVGAVESVLVGAPGCPICSVQNVLENNAINGKLSIYGMDNTVKGGYVRNELIVQQGANTNKFDGVDFTGAKATLNSLETTGTAFDNNAFDGTEFTEDNAVVRLGNNNSIKNAVFGKNLTLIVEGTGNSVEGLTLDEVAGVTVGSGAIGAEGGANVLKGNKLKFKPGAGVVCNGCRLEGNEFSYSQTGSSSAPFKRASFEALCTTPNVCSIGAPDFPPCQGEWRVTGSVCAPYPAQGSCWQCYPLGSPVAPSEPLTPAPIESLGGRSVLVTLKGTGPAIDGGSIAPGASIGLFLNGTVDAVVSNTALSGDVVDAGSGTIFYGVRSAGGLSVLGVGNSGKPRLVAYSTFKTVTLDHSAFVRYLSGSYTSVVFADADSMLQRDWNVSVSVLDSQTGEPVQGAFVYFASVGQLPASGSSDSISRRVGGSINASNGYGEANLTQGIYSQNTPLVGGMKGFKAAYFAGGGSYNPYKMNATAPGYGASSTEGTVEGDGGFVVKLLAGGYETCESYGCGGAVCAPSAPVGFIGCVGAGTNECGEGLHCFVAKPAQPSQNPNGLYFVAVYPTRTQLAGTVPIKLSLQYQGAGLCVGNAMTVYVTGPLGANSAQKQAFYKSCDASTGLHEFSVDLTAAGSYQINAYASNEAFGSGYATASFRLIGQPPKATPDVGLLGVAFALLVAGYALTKKR